MIDLAQRPPPRPTDWQPHELATLRALHAAGKTARQIREALPRRSVGAIQQRRQLLGLDSQAVNNPWTAKQIATLQAMRAVGETAADIAAAVGRSTKAVEHQLRALGLVRPQVARDVLFDFIDTYPGESDAAVAELWREAYPDSPLGAAAIAYARRQMGRPSAKAIWPQASRRAAARMGWPGCVAREAQILDRLYTVGPQTGRQLAALLGLSLQRTQVYLSRLRAAGYLLCLPTTRPRQRGGDAPHLYVLLPAIARQIE